MAIRKISFKISEKQRGCRLDQALAESLPETLGQAVSKGKVRKLLVAGAVYLNGKRVRIASKTLLPGATIEAFIDVNKLNAGGTAQDRVFVMAQDRILYEDAQLIIVNKPAGLPTQPTLDDARDNLFAAVRRHLTGREKSPPYLALHHRLDRDTSGVLLLVKDPAVNAAVARLFTERLAQKIYHALTVRPHRMDLEQEWTVRNFLGPAPKRPGAGKRTSYTAVRAGGDAAHTDFRLLETFGNALYIEARPRTGRTHQIRVHLSEAGMPIIADDLYGGRSAAAPRLMLHAASLTFPHPVTNVEITVQSPLPQDFRECLDRLRLDHFSQESLTGGRNSTRCS